MENNTVENNENVVAEITATPVADTTTTNAVVAEETKGTVRANRKEIVGKVTSNKMDKTIVVSIERRMKHKKYHKFVKKTFKFYAHDEKNECGVNDIVRLMETRPLSKTKRWRLTEILEKAK